MIELEKEGINREQEHNAWKSASKKEIGYGLLWALGGVLLTVITGGVFIFWGAVVWGAWLIIKGLWHLLTK